MLAEEPTHESHDLHNLPHHAHFLTLSCYRRQQFLTDDTFREELLHHWDTARGRTQFAIWSYVIMPEHVHLLVYPLSENYKMASILRSLKESFARWAVKYWKQRAPFMLDRVTVHRDARTLHRFWQEGGGYDRNLYDWAVIERAIEYIERNPVRRELVTDPYDWKWSSARSRAGYDGVPFEVDDFESVASCVQ